MYCLTKNIVDTDMTVLYFLEQLITINLNFSTKIVSFSDANLSKSLHH